jgi:hypothetical protein
MGVIEWLAVTWKDARFAVVAAFTCLCALVVSCRQVGIGSVSSAGVEVTAAIPSPGLILASTENDDREFQEDELEACGLPCVWIVTPPSLTLSQITPQPSLSLSLLTPAQRPLRC